MTEKKPTVFVKNSMTKKRESVLKVAQIVLLVRWKITRKYSLRVTKVCIQRFFIFVCFSNHYIGPPITGPCGASYRPSENFAISSGHQPFVVEISVKNRNKCLGTIVTVRHVLTVGKCYFNYKKAYTIFPC